MLINNGLLINPDLTLPRSPHPPKKRRRRSRQEHGATATFFLCSDYVNGFEEEAEKLLAENHEFLVDTIGVCFARKLAEKPWKHSKIHEYCIETMMIYIYIYIEIWIMIEFSSSDS